MPRVALACADEDERGCDREQRGREGAVVRHHKRHGAAAGGCHVAPDGHDYQYDTVAHTTGAAARAAAEQCIAGSEWQCLAGHEAPHERERGRGMSHVRISKEGPSSELPEA